MSQSITAQQPAPLRPPTPDPGYLTLPNPEATDGEGKIQKPDVYQCQICDARYERLDHVKRHMHSHENARPFKCPTCPRRFNRRDLLSRHRAIHDQQDDSPRKNNKRADRAIQACQSCILAKTKCDDQRPCKRCENRGIRCEPGAGRTASTLVNNNDAGHLRGASVSGLTTQKTQGSDIPTALDINQLAPHPQADYQTPLRQNQGIETFPENAPEFSRMPDLPDSFSQYSLIGNSFMEDSSWDDIAFHADLSQLYQDIDFRFDETLQSVHSESWPLGETSAEVSGSAQNSIPETTQQNAKTVPTMKPLSGYEAFKRSPWLWTPANQDHAYAEHDGLAVNEDHIMASPELNDSNQLKGQPQISDSGTRDEILAMVLKFSKTSLKIRSFPSLNLLNILLQAYFVKEQSGLDSWIHRPSFNPDRSKPELVAGIIASGSTLFAVPNIWKMGLALQETVKLAICDRLDEDNRLARQLQTGQTFLLWQEVGLWSGFRRKMEIGEGFAHTVPTMLRRAGAFHSSGYVPVIFPTPADNGEVLELKWTQWIEQESFKRLVLKVFINEMRSSIAFVRSPVFSGVEFTFPLPAARDLWDAKDAGEWKLRYLAKPPQNQPTTATIIDGMHDPTRLEVDASSLDLEFSAHAILYGLWGRVWGYLDSKSFHQRNRATSFRATSALWLDAQHQELVSIIQSCSDKLAKMRVLSPEGLLVSELLMMSLYVCSEDVQRFAGRFGEEEARSALPSLREWARRDERRRAEWHAGQVLRNARKLPPTQIRGFYAISVYHASLTLWVSVLLSKRSGTSSRTSPSRGIELRAPQFGSDSRVFLDGDESAEVRAYLATGRGMPGLRLSTNFMPISDSSVIPKVLMDIFTSNFPEKAPLPPLLEKLGSLMHDLSRGEAAS